MASLQSSPAWKALKAHHKKVSRLHMRDLFATDEAGDANRFERFSLDLDGLLLDYSKNRVTSETMDLLGALAREADVEGRRDTMFSGGLVNTTEMRAALHTALRRPADAGPVETEGRDVMPDVLAMRAQMRKFTDDVRSGAWAGATGKPIQAIVHIGTGGSHLGPELVTQALAPLDPEGPASPSVHFISNVDGVQITAALAGLSPETTLFVIASKTFTTEETMANARTAKAWLTDALGGDAAANHFVAVSANGKAVSDFGIPAANTFEIWDWVGGRYSVWSAIGLPIALALGMDAFEELLAGAHAMDRHFQDAPPDANMPVILGLIGLWNTDFLGAQSLAILPYDEGLRGLPNYLRQLEMESTGKAISGDGKKLDAGGATVVFGDPGTRGQHAFYQALHQGRQLIVCDFIAPLESRHQAGDHHDRLLANFLAQTEALMKGRTIEETKAALAARGVAKKDIKKQLPHRTFEGNRPTNSILADRFDAFTLGQLLALYEHKTFVQAAIWNINPFDQWGVEWGKELAQQILAEITDGTFSDAGGDAGPSDTGEHCSSTLGLIARMKDRQKDHKG